MSSLKGRTFGSLEVVCLWGLQSTNKCWIYFCRACGHVGRRLATKLTTGRAIRCPACKDSWRGAADGFVFAHLKPDPDRVAELMDTAPQPKVKKRVHRFLRRYSTQELHDLTDEIEDEVARRIGL